jgi:hypothetical protein
MVFQASETGGTMVHISNSPKAFRYLIGQPGGPGNHPAWKDLAGDPVRVLLLETLPQGFQPSRRGEHIVIDEGEEASSRDREPSIQSEGPT